MVLEVLTKFKPKVEKRLAKDGANLYLSWGDRCGLNLTFAMPFGKCSNGKTWVYFKPIELSLDSHSYGVDVYISLLNFTISFDYQSKWGIEQINKALKELGLDDKQDDEQT